MATRMSRPRIIVDCTHTFHTGARTGIQRVVRQYADALLAIGRDEGFEVIPARASGGSMRPLPIESGRVAFPSAASARESVDASHAQARSGARALHAAATVVRRATGSRRVRAWLEAGPNEDGYLRRSAALSSEGPPGDAIALVRDDILFSPDSSWVYDIRSVLDAAGRAGAGRFVLLHDVLPMSQPRWFADGTRRWFSGWLEALLPRVDGFITTTEATRADLAALAASGKLAAKLPPSAAVRLGAELGASAEGPVRAEIARAFAAGAPSFLSVGTIEPRKNVDYALDLFDTLQARGVDCRWHVVGPFGWMAERTAERMRAHPLLGERLHWWTDLTDAEIAWCYRNAAALVAASHAEGFGLPPVEARLHGTPVFAADIPVFREVLRDEARYLPLSSAPIAAAMLEDFIAGGARRDPAPSRVARSWRESAEELLATLLAMRR
jgi:glycosyltransferase involved in cell wall biosynthesis